LLDTVKHLRRVKKSMADDLSAGLGGNSNAAFRSAMDATSGDGSSNPLVFDGVMQAYLQEVVAAQRQSCAYTYFFARNANTQVRRGKAHRQGPIPRRVKLPHLVAGAGVARDGVRA
jgi:hypothetical protein